MSKADHSKSIPALLKQLRRNFEAPPVQPREPVLELVYSFLIWESTTAKADHALRRLLEGIVDLNELRAARIPSISAALGKTYPLGDERAERMHTTLNDLFRREHALTLEKALKKGKKDGRAYIESLDGIPSYVAARAALFSLGAHAVPLDSRLLSCLIDEEVFEETETPDHAQGILERYVSAAESQEAHLLLQAWADEHATGTPGARRTPVRAKSPAPRGRAVKAAKQ
jgi:hypothetical protein